jgi:hypothetical protein
MPARTATKAKKAKQRKAHTSIGVADERTVRSASAIGHALAWGKKKDQFRARELDVTIEVPASGTVAGDMQAFVEIRAYGHSSGPIDVEQREWNFDAELGDLPLLAMALQEALRIGIEQGSFPDPHGKAFTEFGR